jgi:Lon protease-like protein
MIKVTDEQELLTAVESIPLFPLPGMVFIPYTVLPLHVFEARYRDLVDDAMSGNRYLAVPRLRPGWESNYESSPPMFDIAGFGKILRYEPLADGRANIVLLGLGRMRIRTELPSDSLYRVAEGHLLGDILPKRGPAALASSVARLRMMLAQIVGGRPELADRLGPLMDKAMEAIPFVNALAHLLLPDVDARQRYLELDPVEDRIDHIETLLAGAVTAAAAQA